MEIIQNGIDTFENILGALWEFIESNEVLLCLFYASVVIIVISVFVYAFTGRKGGGNDDE